MKSYYIALLVAVLCGVLRIQAQDSTCNRCRAFALTLTCETQSDKVKLLNNGYACAAKSGVNVKLICDLDDSDGLDVSYEWYKSMSIGGESLSKTGTKINDCTTKECILNNVKWEKDSSDHHSVFYQCIVTVKDYSEGHSPVFYSNAFPLLVQSYTPSSGTVSTSKRSIDIGTSEVQLPCEIPASNPPSQVVWYYASSASTNRSELMGDMNDMFVVTGTLKATEAKYGYSKGMLVVMKFKAGNVGVYTCAARNKNSFGDLTESEISQITLESSGQSVTGSDEFRIVSYRTKPDFLFVETDETHLECQGASYIAGVTAHVYWQRQELQDGNLVYKNLTGSGFKYLNQNRTLSLDYSIDNWNKLYRCQIQKGAYTLLQNGFKQSPILPKTGMIPTALTCSVRGQQHTLTANKLLNSDPAIASVQVLPGSQYFWQHEAQSVSKFTPGYEVTDNLLRHTTSSNAKCHYAQQFKYISNVYAVQQIHGINILRTYKLRTLEVRADSNVVLSVEEKVTEVPKIQIKKSGGSGDEPIKIECEASVSYSDALKNKIGLNVVFDLGGCIEYTDAKVELTSGKGTCDTTVTRTLTLNKKIMCKDCVVKCVAMTDCKSSEEASMTISGEGSNCEGKTGTTTGDDDGLPGWGIALIVLAVILGLIGIAAIFFYTYMQKAETEAAAQKGTESGAITTTTISKDNERSEIVKVITMSDENEESPADIL